MVQAGNRAPTANFRDDPLIMSLLRLAVTTVGARLPDMSDASFELLMGSYRERNGERSSIAAFSVGKFQLESHFSKFRSNFAKVLADCLQSQMDRTQGREPAWPTLDSESPELVPDTVIERRLAIDQLTRLINIDAEEGVRSFDVLLGQALGAPFKSIRDNPLRPAAFFHALGQCWTQASGSDHDELLILGQFGPAIASLVSGLYPKMCALLREGLGVPKSSIGLLLPRGDEREGSPYSRLSTANPGVCNDEQVTTSSRQGASATLSPSSEHGQIPKRAAPEARQTMLDFEQIDQVNALFEKTVSDERLPREVRLVFARMQLPFVKASLSDATVLQDPKHPLRRLLETLMNPAAWKRDQGGTQRIQNLLMHLDVVSEMLKRERRDAQRDALLFEHLRVQFLALSKAPIAESTV